MTKLHFTESQRFVEYSKYYVCGIKIKTKVMGLHKIRVEKITLFHLKKCAVNDF